MSSAPQSQRGERGQVLSSVVAVAAVVAVVIGLLVLFGTGGPGGSSDNDNKAGGTQSSSAASTPPAVSSSPPPPVTTTATATATATTTAPQPTRTVTRTAQPPRATTTKPALGPRPAVEIFNNTRERGLADRTASRARSAGWTVAGIDNWTGKIATTSVYYPLGMYTQAGRLASDLGVGRIKAALGNMKTDRLTVILTTDYSG